MWTIGWDVDAGSKSYGAVRKSTEVLGWRLLGGGLLVVVVSIRDGPSRFGTVRNSPCYVGFSHSTSSPGSTGRWRPSVRMANVDTPPPRRAM